MHGDTATGAIHSADRLDDVTAAPRLIVQTREIDPVDDLFAFADADNPLVWSRRGDGMVGFGGAVLSLTPPRGDGVTRTARLSEVWAAISAAAEIDDPVQLPGTGLAAFGALVFDERSDADSVLVVPSAIVGRHRGRSWLTRIHVAGSGAADAELTAVPYGSHWSGTLGPGQQSPERYQDAVRAALSSIDSGAISKVVLARDLTGTVPAGADLRRLVRALASDYPDTWAYAVDGLIGASPETLVTVAGGTVTARVLAGTASRGADPDADALAAVTLVASTKDQDEHQYAVRSVVDALAPHVTSVAASEQPFTLKLPNLWHLATDVEAMLSGAASALDLVSVLHPTAAVAGAPTAAALEEIARLEPFDRGRYAGPVGWIDGNGDGEWAIALRCAQFALGPSRGEAAYTDTISVTAYAGAGIVAGSDPESEMLETRVKFRPIVDALA